MTHQENMRTQTITQLAMSNEQGVKNFIASVLFGLMLMLAMYLLYIGPGIPTAISEFEFVLLALAVFRVVRFFAYDKITEWLRDIFYDVRVQGEEVIRTKPSRGVRRTIIDLLLCPWCLGVWASLFITFFYFYTPFAWFPIIMLAIAGVGSLFAIFANLIGWYAEGRKREVEGNR